MHVIRVELENIKCYKEETFNFERGTTAIVGRNGAGKTTILEAIAWTLFDVLEYSKDDFLRRGAKKGSVRVTFESVADGRQYVVYRDTGTNYFVFDPVLNARIADKKIDVTAILRMHLGIEAGTDMQSLFRSAIGVPQGSFTADFVRTANQRKASFDRLLKVEEYREGADRLRETNNLIRDRIIEIRERIAGAEGQLARYDDLVAAQKETQAQAHELENSLIALQSEAAALETALEALDAAEQEVVRVRALAERAAAHKEAADAQAGTTARELETAERARARQLATEADYHAHRAALEALSVLENERAEREPLRRESEGVAALLVAAERDVRRLENDRERALQARAAEREMAPAVGEQEAFERERERLRDLRASAQAARAECARLDRDLELLRTQHAQTKERVREATAAHDAHQTVERLESERLYIENELARERDLATTRKHLSGQHREMESEVKRLQAVIASLDQEMRSYETLASGATHANGLERRAHDLAERAANLRAEITRDEKMRAEVRGGLCPILSQKCLNIAPDQTLEGYFTDHLAANHETLAQVEAQREEITLRVQAAREATVAAARLESARLRLDHERALLGERLTSLDELNRAQRKIGANGETRLREMQMQMFGLDGELKSAREAARRFAELETQQARMREIAEEGKRKRDARAELSAAAEGAETLENELGELERRLKTLGDARSKAAALRGEADRETAIARELGGARDALAALVRQKKVLEEHLVRFATLDARWAEETSERERTMPAYREYLAVEASAATLDARRADHENATDAVARATAEMQTSADELRAALAAYDREEHARRRGMLALAREQIAVATAQLNAARESARVRADEIARLDEVRASMREEFLAKERLERLNEATDFIRDILKAAGPLVTESYLYNISVEANQLFRDITGEAHRTLRWSRDYEIILEEDGFERSFVNLSGGEQMAAALSVRLALLKELSDIRLAFFDEPTVNMDAERRERLAVAIGQIRSFDQLFVISHDDTFEESVDHIVHIHQDENESAQVAATAS